MLDDKKILATEISKTISDKLNIKLSEEVSRLAVKLIREISTQAKNSFNVERPAQTKQKADSTDKTPTDQTKNPLPESKLEKTQTVQSVEIKAFDQKALDDLGNKLTDILPKAIKNGLADLDKSIKTLGKDVVASKDGGGGGLLDGLLNTLGLGSLFKGFKKPGVPTAKPGKIASAVSKAGRATKGLAGGGLATAAAGLAAAKGASLVTGKILGKDEQFEKIEPEKLKEVSNIATENKDEDSKKKYQWQIKEQKKQVKIEAAQTGAAAAGYVVGTKAAAKLIASTASTRAWRVFMVYVKRKAPQLFAKIGLKLASAAGLAAIPFVGWVGAAVNIGFTLWTAWDLYTLWKEFSALSDIERQYYADEKNSEPLPDDKIPKIPEDKDKSSEIKEASVKLPEGKEQPANLSEMLDVKHGKDPLKRKNYDNIAAELVKQGITSPAEYETAVRDGKISKEFDEAFKKQYTSKSLGETKGKELFAQKLGLSLQAAQVKKAAEVSPNQQNYKVSGNIIEGNKAENVTANKSQSVISSSAPRPINVDKNVPAISSSDESKRSLDKKEIIKKLRSMGFKTLTDVQKAEEDGILPAGFTKNIAIGFGNSKTEGPERLMTGYKAFDLMLQKEGLTEAGVSAGNIKNGEYVSPETERPTPIEDGIISNKGLEISTPKGQLFSADPSDIGVFGTKDTFKKFGDLINNNSKSEPFDNKSLKDSVNETKITNNKLDSLITGFNNLAKALTNAGMIEKAPVVVSNVAGNQSQQPSQPTSSQYANMGNSDILNFRSGIVEAARFQPA